MIVVLRPVKELTKVVRRVANELPSHLTHEKAALYQAADRLEETIQPDVVTVRDASLPETIWKGGV